jgi:hypothetical protein
VLYPKIPGPFMRFIDGPNKNQLDLDTWSRPEFDLLKDLPWEWTEKVNGTNVRVIWDGYKVRFGGRTDNAQMPIKLVEALQTIFPEELLEQKFGASPAVLFGEGCGAGIASGSGVYSQDPGFVLFDVHIEGWWLERDNLVNVAQALGIQIVPTAMIGTIEQAIALVIHGYPSYWGDFMAEGLVGKAPMGLLTRGGERLMVKIKTKDFRV